MHVIACRFFAVQKNSFYYRHECSSKKWIQTYLIKNKKINKNEKFKKCVDVLYNSISVLSYVNNMVKREINSATRRLSVVLNIYLKCRIFVDCTNKIFIIHIQLFCLIIFYLLRMFIVHIAQNRCCFFNNNVHSFYNILLWRDIVTRRDTVKQQNV